MLGILLLFAKWVCMFPVPTPCMMGELLVLAGIGEYILIQSRKLQAIQKKKKPIEKLTTKMQMLRKKNIGIPFGCCFFFTQSKLQAHSRRSRLLLFEP
jgi:hypothetical protein